MKVEFDPAAASDLAALDTTIAQRILTKIRWLADNFSSVKPSRLHGDMAGFHKLRVGDWRVLYERHERTDSLMIRVIGHRRQIYKPGR